MPAEGAVSLLRSPAQRHGGGRQRPRAEAGRAPSLLLATGSGPRCLATERGRGRCGARAAASPQPVGAGGAVRGRSAVLSAGSGCGFKRRCSHPAPAAPTTPHAGSAGRGVLAAARSRVGASTPHRQAGAEAFSLEKCDASGGFCLGNVGLGGSQRAVPPANRRNPISSHARASRSQTDQTQAQQLRGVKSRNRKITAPSNLLNLKQSSG